MSPRRFFAYFLAVSAGSTVAFAPTLRGQPAPPVRDAAVVLTPMDAGTDALPPEAVRLYRAGLQRQRHRHAPEVELVSRAK